MEKSEKGERTWKQYALNVIHTLRGEEHFVGTDTAQAEGVLVGSLAGFFLLIIFCIAYCYGAAKLSWSYNSYYGATTSTKVIFSILCYIFPFNYYPFYAFFLDPITGRLARTQIQTLTGAGRR